MDAVLELDNVCKFFGQNCILEGVSFQVNQGEMVAIVGESGSGKTTLLNILGLISVPSSGSYKIYGNTIHNIHSKNAMLLRRNSIGYLFQNYGLVEDETVEWNLKLAFAYKKVARKQRDQLIEQLLEEFHLGGMQKNKVFQLSGGEQQRVALIKLVIQDPEIILADEPTGSLDAGNRDVVMRKLLDLNKQNKTIVIVTHDLAVADMCGKIIDMKVNCCKKDAG